MLLMIEIGKRFRNSSSPPASPTSSGRPQIRTLWSRSLPKSWPDRIVLVAVWSSSFSRVTSFASMGTVADPLRLVSNGEEIRNAETRGNHDAGFKARVALEAVKGERTVSELAAESGVHSTMIQQWKKTLLDGAADIFGCGGRKPVAEVDEETVRSLHAKIGELAVANDFLS